MARRRKSASERRGMGELEAQVLDVLWNDGGWMTPAEVNARLATGRELAYTTVMTILVRLLEKDLLVRERRGRAWAYRPVRGREEQAAHRMSDLLRSGGDEAVALARFVESMTPKQRDELRRVLQQRKRAR